jgi:hypothetical protein
LNAPNTSTMTYMHSLPFVGPPVKVKCSAAHGCGICPQVRSAPSMLEHVVPTYSMPIYRASIRSCLPELSAGHWLKEPHLHPHVPCSMHSQLDVAHPARWRRPRRGPKRGRALEEREVRLPTPIVLVQLHTPPRQEDLRAKVPSSHYRSQFQPFS